MLPQSSRQARISAWKDAVKSLGEESDQKFVRDLDALLVRIGCQPTVRIGGLDRGDWKNHLYT